ncbi:MAG TPA: hypothetical protein VFA13_09995 [Candidatus Acidoferrum sp.]|jgi:hypothetical protein|nr:hypothetical protein [Candidatus Acidoferrum sp.]
MAVLLDPTAHKTSVQPETRTQGPSNGSRRPVSFPPKQEDSTQGGYLQANVTFRRDAAGQIYYVVTDATTGKELRELPAEQVRAVAEGIQEFLKAEQSRGAKSLEVKA